MAHRRPERVGEQIQRQLAQMLQFELRDPRLAMLNITDVEMTPDLRLARVYFSLLGSDDPKVRKDAMAGLRAASGFMRRQLGQIGLKYVPDLRFFYDTSGARAQRLMALIGEVSEGHSHGHIDAADPADRADVQPESEDPDPQP